MNGKTATTSLLRQYCIYEQENVIANEVKQSNKLIRCFDADCFVVPPRNDATITKVEMVHVVKY